MDGNGNYLDVNEAFARIVGRSTTAVVGLNLREVTHPDDVALSESAFVAAMSDKPAMNFQKQYVRPDGSVRTASITYSALGEPRDAGRQVYAHVLDVTDEVEATRATKASEAELTDTRSRYTRQQEALARLGQAALDSREIPKLLQFGCELAVEALGVAFCGVPNVTTGRTTLDIVAAAGRGAQGLKGSKFPIPDDGITTLMRNPSTTVGSNASARMRASNKDWESLDGALASALILDDSRSIWRLVIATTAPFVLSADDVGFLNSVAAILGSAIARQESDERRRELVMRLVVAQEDERARIAGEIHDDSLQAVAASRVQVHRLRNSLAGEAAERANVVEHVLGEASERLRDLLFRLSPQDINTKGGLESALTELAARTAKEHPLKVTLEVRGDLDLEPGMRVLVYRTVQEALVNTLKHAAAHEAWVAVERTAREATISVRDDGSGFDSSAPPATGHIGLLAARTRIDDAGGTLTLASGVGLGTTIEVRLPLGGAA
jgi:PAS domain S-box